MYGFIYNICSVPYAAQLSYHLKYVTSNISEHVEHMAMNIKDRLLTFLTNAEWLVSKLYVLKKVSEIGIFIGAPDTILNGVLEEQYATVRRY